MYCQQDLVVVKNGKMHFQCLYNLKDHEKFVVDVKKQDGIF
jgi:hypothetical protein